MTPFYITQFSHMPLVEGDDDHDHEAHLYPFNTLPITTSYSDHHLSSLSYPILFNPPLHLHEGASNNIGHHQIQPHHQLEFIDQLLIQGSSNFPAVSFPNCTNTTSVNNSNQYSASTCDQYMNGQGEEEEDDHHQCKSPAAAGKWMSSKMRIMRKMMNPDGIVTKKPRRRSSKQAAVLLLQDQDQDQQRSTQPSNNSNNNNNSTTSSNDIIIRVCSDCNTTKTPLWRSGPSGPKSLCNACGIRQRKARRALAAAAAVSSGLIPAAAASAAVELTSKDKNSDPLDRTIPFKKRCRFHSTTGSSTTSTAQNRKMKKNRSKQQLGFDDIVIRLSKSSAFHQVFPQDEKDAAILLMALSCGLMCS